ncbi:hypothetical protein [Nonomuraea sp. NPDC048916]|uniref:hypothetical protein n=1 Tax=Nonomuraea sp. NPDC048916 TaxID=3154232 RepID=UPI0033D38398
MDGRTDRLVDRLARSVPDARDIGDTLTRRGIRLSLGGSIYETPVRLAANRLFLPRYAGQSASPPT